MESRDDQTAVRPAHPAAPYIGGKHRLAPQIIERLERLPHSLYAEPFVGMGGVFFRRRYRPQHEVINDGNGEVANLFRILQRHYPQFLDTLKFQITSRSEFERLKKTDPATLTDLERAGRFLYLQRTAFGGKVMGQNFGVDLTKARFDLTQLVPTLEALHERLAGVTVEHLDFEDMITRYDGPGTLFFCDPPYWGSEDAYGPQFPKADFRRLANCLRGIKGRFMLTLNDCPDVRRLFDGFAMTELKVAYSVAAKNKAAFGELLITNTADGGSLL